MFRKLVANIISNLTRVNPWSNVYGLARTLLATSTLITLIFNDIDILFRPAHGIDMVPFCIGTVSQIGLFCVFSNSLFIAKIISILILILVAIGWRPMITGILHWWISFSFSSSALLIDGGDHVTTVLTFLLIPVTLTDKRKWHWLKVSSKGVQNYFSGESRKLIANFSFKLIRLQVAIIYLHAAVAKCSVPEWVNGTALYYWFTHPIFGMSTWIEPLVYPLLTNPFFVTISTWIVIALEFLLFAGLFMERKNYRYLLILGIAFHASIAVIHGLVSFFIAMIAALILFLQPVDAEFTFINFNNKNALSDSEGKF